MAALVTALVATAAAAFAWLCWHEAHQLAAWAPPLVYSSLAALLFVPFNMAHRVGELSPVLRFSRFLRPKPGRVF